MKKISVLMAISIMLIAQSFANPRGHHTDHRSQVQVERIRLDYNIHLRSQRGEPKTLFLKKQLRIQNPGIDLRALELESVVLVAKSKHGGGKASLVVGGYETREQYIDVGRDSFRGWDRRTFSQIDFQNRQRSSEGKWQISLRGNIKVLNVILVVRNKARSLRSYSILMNPNDVLRGQNVLKIKRLLSQEHPGLNLRALNIRSVTLMAKSRMGRGEAVLFVGGNPTYPEVIPGSPRWFQSSSPRSFSAVKLINPNRDSRGRVQVELRGNIKIDEIIVKVAPLILRRR